MSELKQERQTRQFPRKWKERKWTCNITFRRLCTTFAAVEKQKVLHITSVCLQPQVSSMQCATPYCLLWPTQLCNNFSRYLKNGMIFRKKVSLNTKFAFLSSLQLFFNATFPILRRNERDMIIKVYWSSSTVPVIFVRF